MNKIMHELYTFEDKTSDEVLLINGFQHINQLIPYINDLQQENQSLKDSMQTIMEMVCTIEHNIDKYEEIGTENHFEYAQKKTWELKDYLYDLLKGDK